MTTAVRALACVVLLVGLSAPLPHSAVLSQTGVTSPAIIEPAAVDTPHDRVSVGGAPTPGDRALALHAVELFGEAGLVLPELEILFHTAADACGNKNGLYRREGHRHSVEICRPRKRTVIHELAHAWSAHNLSQVEIEAFLRMRGLEVWHSSEHGWATRGIEHAAEIITWGLSDTPIGIPLPANDCDSLVEGFLLLTGAEPLHGLTDHCESPLDFRYSG